MNERKRFVLLLLIALLSIALLLVATSTINSQFIETL